MTSRFRLMHSPSPNAPQVRSFRAVSALVAATLLGTYVIVDFSKRKTLVGAALYRSSEPTPLMHVADRSLRFKLEAQEREFNMSSRNLANMTAIRKANSDVSHKVTPKKQFYCFLSRYQLAATLVTPTLALCAVGVIPRSALLSLDLSKRVLW